MLKLMIVTIALLVTGCTMDQKFFKNYQTGQLASCHASASGLIPAIIASNQFDDCVKFLEGQGYVEQIVD